MKNSPQRKSCYARRPHGRHPAAVGTRYILHCLRFFYYHSESSAARPAFRAYKTRVSDMTTCVTGRGRSLYPWPTSLASRIAACSTIGLPVSAVHTTLDIPRFIPHSRLPDHRFTGLGRPLCLMYITSRPFSTHRSRLTLCQRYNHFVPIKIRVPTSAHRSRSSLMPDVHHFVPV